MAREIHVHEPDEWGEYDSQVYPFEDDEFDSAVDQAIGSLWRDHGVSEPSQIPGFSTGLWYSDPDNPDRSAHLHGWTPQEEKEIWAGITALRQGRPWEEPEVPTHPDPWMDNEPGSLTLPEHWGRVRTSNRPDWMPRLGGDAYVTPEYLQEHKKVTPWQWRDQGIVQGDIGTWDKPLYHVTHPENRERIRNYGLLPSRPARGMGNFNISFQPEGVYLHTDPESAQRWDRTYPDWSPMPYADIWEVDPRYVNNAVEDKMLGGPVATHPIPPEALTLREDLGRSWDPHNIEGQDYWKPWPEGDPRVSRWSAVQSPRIWREAAKIDKLRKEMVKPEQQPLLHYFEALHGYVGDKIDKLLPWLAREVKKGNLVHRYPSVQEGGRNALPPAGVLEMPTARGQQRIMPDSLSHIADWYADKRAPNRQGLDIMQTSFPEVLHEKIPEWQNWMEELKTKEDAETARSAPVVHQYPDGWTVNQLRPEDLPYETSHMGHCVGRPEMGYADKVANGNTLIYSLRDPKLIPHATVEIEPTEWENPVGNKFTDPGSEVVDPVPHNGRIEQIQGKQDTVPIPEYQERLKQWFETFPEHERPYWEGGEVTEPRELIEEREDAYGNEPYGGGMGGYGPHGDYGVKTRDEPYWPMILDNNLGEGGYRGQHHHVDPEAIYLAALKRREIPQLAKALEKHGEEQQSSFDEWRFENPEYQVSDPELYQDEEGEYPLQLYGGETVENPEEHEEAYLRDLEGWEEEHPGLTQTNKLYQYLLPHWNEERYEGTNKVPGYVNEIRADPTAYVADRSAKRYFGHPAQKMWENGEVPEMTVPAAPSPAPEVQ